ncbi:hypothetical protein [Geopseudomonas aromaticivorans]
MLMSYLRALKAFIALGLRVQCLRSEVADYPAPSSAAAWAMQFSALLGVLLVCLPGSSVLASISASILCACMLWTVERLHGRPRAMAIGSLLLINTLIMAALHTTDLHTIAVLSGFAAWYSIAFFRVLLQCPREIAQ